MACNNAADAQSRVSQSRERLPGTGEQAAALLATNGVVKLRSASRQCRRLANDNVKTAKVRRTRCPASLPSTRLLDAVPLLAFVA